MCALAVACGKSGACGNSADPARIALPATQPYACARLDAGPSRAAFLDEVLVAEPSLSTSLFDDYTRGSYHVRKGDLVQGLRERATECGVRLRAVVVFGPVGPLWA